MIRALAVDECIRMTQKELAYRFELRLDSSPEQLWPLVSDTNRFNRDAGLPALDGLGVGDNARRRLRLTRLGVGIEWEEEPFEWVSPRRGGRPRASPGALKTHGREVGGGVRTAEAGTPPQVSAQGGEHADIRVQPSGLALLSAVVDREGGVELALHVGREPPAA
jgi:hypothetical protein